MGLHIHFSSSGCVVKIQTKQTVEIGCKVGPFLKLTSIRVSSPLAISASTFTSLSVWHSRLSHVYLSFLRSLDSSDKSGLR